MDQKARVLGSHVFPVEGNSVADDTRPASSPRNRMNLEVSSFKFQVSSSKAKAKRTVCYIMSAYSKPSASAPVLKLETPLPELETWNLKLETSLRGPVVC